MATNLAPSDALHCRYLHPVKDMHTYPNDSDPDFAIIGYNVGSW